ncbi:hypothetical protein PGB90_001186 [Kerria lacca]
MFKLNLRSTYSNSKQIRHVFLDSKKVNLEWEGVVGLEIHAQIDTCSKLFSGSGTSFTKRVNEQVSFFDAALPGTLPVLNKECVKKGVLTALALNCDIHSISWFDRKHYFYADLPAGYQITQQRAPFATNGAIEFHCYSSDNRNKSYLKTSKIKQIQLEQDSGKSLHETSENLSFIDLNRAGIPLMEIVFNPDLNSGDEAACLVRELILILKQLQTCSCKIEEGALRVDANVSVRPKGSNILDTRTEVKNIGSIGGVLKAVNFEIERQIRFRKANKEVINETRAWDASINRTVTMRDKEVEQDYRFMPEPNLPPLKLSLDENDMKSNLINVPLLKKQIPELPSSFRNNLITKYKLSIDTVLRLLVEPILLKYFLLIMEENNNRNPVKISNFLMMDLLAVLTDVNIDIENCTVEAKLLGELHDLFSNEIINRVILIKVLTMLITGTKESPSEIVEKNQLYQINERSIIEESCKLTIEFNPEWVEQYYKTKKLLKKKSYQLLFNEAIKNTNGRANLKMSNEILQELLEKKS